MQADELVPLIGGDDQPTQGGAPQCRQAGGGEALGIALRAPPQQAPQLAAHTSIHPDASHATVAHIFELTMAVTSSIQGASVDLASGSPLDGDKLSGKMAMPTGRVPSTDLKACRTQNDSNVDCEDEVAQFHGTPHHS